MTQQCTSVTKMTTFCLLFSLIFICSSHALLKGPLTPDFTAWLATNGYEKWVSEFLRNDLGPYGSFGGRSSPNQQVKNRPIIFIHGNSDKALNDGKVHGLTGWTESINFFMNKGYSSAELYATTWGPNDIMKANEQVHSCAYLTKLRKFVEAVKAYTGASTVDVISHSMGVTLARKVVRGGNHMDKSESCEIGQLLTDSVDTFIGIAGGNRGLAACFAGESLLTPACNNVNGFDPGYCWFGVCKGNAEGMSEYLALLNSGSHGFEGRWVFSIWSHGDTVIGGGDYVYGYPTSEILGQSDEKVYLTYGHIQLKDETLGVQYNMVVEHSV